MSAIPWNTAIRSSTADGGVFGERPDCQFCLPLGMVRVLRASYQSPAPSHRRTRPFLLLRLELYSISEWDAERDRKITDRKMGKVRVSFSLHFPVGDFPVLLLSKWEVVLMDRVHLRFAAGATP
jgi:hypothetical protein